MTNTNKSYSNFEADFELASNDLFNYIRGLANMNNELKRRLDRYTESKNALGNFREQLLSNSLKTIKNTLIEPEKEKYLKECRDQNSQSM